MESFLAFTPESDACRHLSRADSKLRELISRIGSCEASLRPDPYPALLRSIIGQQLSTTVARVIWERFVQLGATHPKAVAAISDEALRRAGLSRQKIAYVRSLSDAILNGTVALDKLQEMDDEAIISQLTAVKGVGRWTVEMFLIFSLGRPDVWSLGDLGLKKGVMLLDGLNSMPTPREMSSRAEIWRPFRTVAALYLWQSLES